MQEWLLKCKGIAVDDSRAYWPYFIPNIFLWFCFEGWSCRGERILVIADLSCVCPALMINLDLAVFSDYTQPRAWTPDRFLTAHPEQRMALQSTC